MPDGGSTHKVHTGPRGGRYIMVHKKKVYIHKK